MSCVAGHQPNLYPYAGFFAKAAHADRFVIVDNSQYVKKEYHNRNRILLRDGSVKWLHIPVKNSGRYKQRINEAEIDGTAWRRVHERTLALNYKRAPWFEWLFPELLDLWSRDWRFLADYNIAFIDLCFGKLGISTPDERASDLGISGVATELIADICAKTGCDTYLHGKHARDYVDFELLESRGVKNLLQDYDAAEYPQTVPGFVPNLSILDAMFNNGPSTLEVVLQGQRVGGV